MADYTAIQNANLEPGAPWISATSFALRDNPIAIAEGAAGAPRIQNAAVTNGTLGAEKLQSGATERDWVLARCAVASVGAVGTYAFLHADDIADSIQPGDTQPGSVLSYAGGTDGSGTRPSGTWRAMGVGKPVSGTETSGVNTVYLKLMTEYTNPRYNENGTIDVDINHPDFGWIPFTASPDDVEPHGRQIFADLKDEATPYTPPEE